MSRSRTTLAAAVAAALLLVTAAPASAHSFLLTSTPAADETLTALPEQFSVTANEPLLELGEQGVFALQIRDAAGRFYGDGCVTVAGATMSAEPAIGESGAYTMLWQVVSADGHPVSGEIPFSWTAPDGFEPAPAFDAPPVCGVDAEPTATPTAPATPSAEPTTPPVVDDGSGIALGIGLGLGALAAIIAVVAVVVTMVRRRGA